MAPHWTGLLIIGLLVLVLFGGRGRISSLMGDMAKGITAFRQGLKDEDENAEKPSIPEGAASKEDEKT
jgi:sec-independent protein translocase protein TatA